MIDLKRNERIQIKNGSKAEVIQKIGEGGQGAVYKVHYAREDYAMKMYFPRAIKKKNEFYSNLENNIVNGSPNESFLWPLYITEMRNGTFGYLMRLRPAGYEDFSKILTAKVQMNSDMAIINAALHLVNAFKDLHSKGYSYQDLNDGNFFINPENGDVLICDNDNVAPYGQNVGVDGKSRYIAPEVVTGKSRPNVHTDRFSLAVVLFMLFFRGHPFEGAKTASHCCLTEQLEKEYYGVHPLFCYDPKDESNRPVRGIHNNVIRLWNMYPRYIQDAFIKVFTAGIKDVNERLTEREWTNILLRYRNSTIKCSCGCYNTFEDEKQEKLTCADCGVEINRPLVLTINKNKIFLYPETRLYTYQIEDSQDLFQEAGMVIINKANKSLWGLKNLSKRGWIVEYSSGEQKSVPYGGVLFLLKGTKIFFGNEYSGEIN